MTTQPLFLLIATLLGMSQLCAQSGEKKPPEELGAVPWERKLETGWKLARERSKPVFLLFQEVPG